MSMIGYVQRLWIVAVSPDGKIKESFIYTPYLHTYLELASIIRYYRNRNRRIHTEWRSHEKFIPRESES